MNDPARRRARAATWALLGLALLVSHDAVYLAHLGPSAPLAEVLRGATHGYWAVASSVLAGIALLAATGVAIHMGLLRRRAAALAAAPTRERSLAPRFLRTWLVYAALIAVAFVVQENVEHVAVHGHIPGMSALVGPQHPLALPVIVAVAALTAGVATLIGRFHGALVAAIEAALRGPARAPRRLVVRPPIELLDPTASVLARRGAGRAPPLVQLRSA